MKRLNGQTAFDDGTWLATILGTKPKHQTAISKPKFFRRSFCAGRELRRPKSDHVHPAFSCFFTFLTPPTSYENPRFPLPLQIKDSLDHAQMIEREILCRIALTRVLYDQIRPYVLIFQPTSLDENA